MSWQFPQPKPSPEIAEMLIAHAAILLTDKIVWSPSYSTPKRKRRKRVQPLSHPWSFTE